MDYDVIGRDYRRCRQPDPRIAAKIHTALGDSRSVVNVGAGAGSYEPNHCLCIAIEPSRVMIEQRSSTAATVLQARAEQLPLGDDSVDTALAILTIHHWTDPGAGLLEMQRVARDKVVVLTWDQTVWADFWLFKEYFPDCDIDKKRSIPIEQIVSTFRNSHVEVVPIPHNCIDGFHGAFWRRPHAYLDPQVRAGISTYVQMPAAELARGLKSLSSDLQSSLWFERHQDLVELAEIDLGYRLVVGAA